MRQAVIILCSAPCSYIHVFFLRKWSSRTVKSTSVLEAAYTLHNIEGLEQCCFVVTLPLGMQQFRSAEQQQKVHYSDKMYATGHVTVSLYIPYSFLLRCHVGAPSSINSHKSTLLYVGIFCRHQTLSYVANCIIFLTCIHQVNLSQPCFAWNFSRDASDYYAVLNSVWNMRYNILWENKFLYPYLLLVVTVTLVV